MPKWFQFEIVREDLRLRYMQSRAMHAMAALFMLLYAMQYAIESPSWLYRVVLFPPSLIILALLLFKRTLFNDIQHIRIFRILELGLLCMGSLHFLQKDNSPISLLYAGVAGFIGLIFYMETRMFSPQWVYFNHTGITVPTLWRTRVIGWQEIDKVVLQGPYLTILLPADRYLQWRIHQTFPPNVLEEFREFCQQHQKQTP